MIRIEMLPASFGDCLLIEYGTDAKRHRILIDAGLKKTYRETLAPRLAALDGGAPVELELLVVTHIDRDHICGILPLLKANPPVIAPKQVWFNARVHLDPADDTQGVAEGEELGKLLAKKKIPWNTSFGTSGEKAVRVPDEGPLPVVPLDGGAVLTLLSPYQKQLTKLAGAWDDELGAWDVDPDGDEDAPEDDDLLGAKAEPLDGLDADIMNELLETTLTEDKTAPNGSSIAFLFEYDGKRILFGADAYPSVMLASLERLSGDRVRLDAFKLSHHGSKNNISAALLEKIECPRFLVSSDGSAYGHPNPETLALIVSSTNKPKHLCFNYRSGYTEVWDDEAMTKAHRYMCVYPAVAKDGFVLEL